MNELKLSTGIVLDCNCGIVGLGPAPNFNLGEGYDGPLYNFEREKQYDPDLTPGYDYLTRADRLALCEVMIARWQAFKEYTENENA